MSSLFSWHSHPAVKKLLGWRQGSEEEKWAEKAVESLVKKLRKKKGGEGTIEDLEFALANPHMHSKCVTIPKSLDGRLQVSHKKGLPHVIYCKVWRWPDLTHHQELRATPDCLYPYDPKGQHTCINPYHYTRVENLSKPFAQQASTHGGYAASSSSSPPYAPSVTSMMSSSPSDSRIVPSPNGSYTTASPMASSYATATSPCSHLSEDDADHIRMEMGDPMIVDPMPPPRLLPPPPMYWASIGYYELNNRVGELFKLTKKTLIVDGFTDPSNSDERICLGLLTNVNRNSTIENARKHIGKGIRIVCTPDYDVYMTNQSNASIFVQSRNVNVKMNQPKDNVFRIPPGCCACVFDNAVFYNMLTRALKEGFTALYDLQKMCFVRISFVKGWGNDYQRHDITSTPCWVELQLHQALSWIDSTLDKNRVPEVEANSMT